MWPYPAKFSGMVDSQFCACEWIFIGTIAMVYHIAIYTTCLSNLMTPTVDCKVYYIYIYLRPRLNFRLSLSHVHSSLHPVTGTAIFVFPFQLLNRTECTCWGLLPWLSADASILMPDVHICFSELSSQFGIALSVLAFLQDSA